MAQRNTTVRDRHRAVIRRGQPPCALCGEPIDYTLKYPDPGCYVVDHILPVIKYPELEHELSNKQPAHNKCNRDKWDTVEGDDTDQPRQFVTHRVW